MKLKFPARSADGVSTTRPMEQSERCVRKAAEEMHWVLVSRADSRLEFRVPMSWKSWGEIVTVTLEPARLLVYSRSRLRTQCFDWGKNRENCLRLLRHPAVA
jgi:hypothetical protein